MDALRISNDNSGPFIANSEQNNQRNNYNNFKYFQNNAADKKQFLNVVFFFPNFQFYFKTLIFFNYNLFFSP